MSLDADYAAAQAATGASLDDDYARAAGRAARTAEEVAAEQRALRAGFPSVAAAEQYQGAVAAQWDATVQTNRGRFDVEGDQLKAQYRENADRFEAELQGEFAEYKAEMGAVWTGFRDDGMTIAEAYAAEAMLSYASTELPGLAALLAGAEHAVLQAMVDAGIASTIGEAGMMLSEAATAAQIVVAVYVLGWNLVAAPWLVGHYTSDERRRKYKRDALGGMKKTAREVGLSDGSAEWLWRRMEMVITTAGNHFYDIVGVEISKRCTAGRVARWAGTGGLWGDNCVTEAHREGRKKVSDPLMEFVRDIMIGMVIEGAEGATAMQIGMHQPPPVFAPPPGDAPPPPSTSTRSSRSKGGAVPWIMAALAALKFKG